ncbi:uncharacterized protein [Dysidea avara]|uniref:uncharacterized protein isoform X2 n=1 Tax=Dysidea avara TaxID=196820 RepID=UPI00331782A9
MATPMATVGKASLTSLGEHVVFQSILHCRQDKHSWKQRYAVLYKNTTLADYKSLKLKSCHTMKIFSDMEQTKTNSQPLFCRANTHEELSIWVASLLVAVGKGKYHYVRHYDKDHSSTMHSILYFTDNHNKETGDNDCLLVLSSPLNDSVIRNSWKIKDIQQFVRNANGIGIECCPKCHKTGETFNRNFTMFMPADRVNTCLRYICKATQFHQTFSDEKKLMGCDNNDKHKYCSPVHEYDEIRDTTSAETICLDPEGYITMKSAQKRKETSPSADTAGNKTGEEKQDGFYVEVRHPNMHIKKPHKSQDNSFSKTDNKKQQTSEPHFYVNVTDQSTSPASETLPNTDSKVAIRSISYDQSPQQHLTESSPVSAQSMDSSVQQGKSDDTDVYPSVSEVCQEKPAQKLKPTPKPRKKKMSHIQGTTGSGAVDASGNQCQECSHKTHYQNLELETNK